MLTLDALRSSGKPLMLTFTDPNCGPCQALLPDLGRWQRELAPTLTLALITSGTADENRNKSGEHGLTQVLLQQDREVMESYRASGTPSAVLIRPDGTIGSALAQGAEDIRALVARSASASSRRRCRLHRIPRHRRRVMVAARSAVRFMAVLHRLRHRRAWRWAPLHQQ